jgi:uncharacterized protein (TIGR00106 family)
MAVMDIQVLPLGTCSTSLSGLIVEAVKVVKASGLMHELTPMGTVVEGEMDELLALAKAMHEAVIAAGAARVMTTIQIDDRRDKKLSMARKVQSVREKLP